MSNTTVASYPLPQSKIINLFGRFLSYVFHPLFIPAYIAAYVIYLHPYAFSSFDDRQKLVRLISIFTISAFFPAITVFLLWRLKFADSIFLRTQKERIIPYVASITYFFWAFYVSRNIPGSPPSMTFFFLGIFLSASAALMANNYFKISMHALAVGGGATFMVLLGLVSGEPMTLAISISSIIAGLVCTSRLLISDHHPFEVFFGFFVGAFFQIVACYVIM